MDTRHAGADSAARHETRDADIRGLLLFALALVGTLVILFFLMARVFHYFRETQSLGPPASPFADARALPPQPRLQVEPRIDLQRLRAGEDAALDSYGWVDQKAGVAHIPIGRAMDIVAEKGLPVRDERGGKK